MSYNFSIVKPDGVSRTVSPTSYSIDKEEVFLQGQITGYDQVKVNYAGTEFTSIGNESDISIVDGTWVFPDPNTSEGIDLDQGSNTFIITASDSNNVGVSATLTVIVISNMDSFAVAPNPPLNLKANRAQDNVQINWVHTDPEISSYNVYASSNSGGNNGYIRLNRIPIDPITYGEKKERTTQIVNLESDIETISEDPNILTIQAAQNTTIRDIGTQEIAENVKRLRISTSVSSVELETTITFNHNRRNPDPLTTLSVGEFTSLSEYQPLYYVVTSVKVIDNQEVESAFSVEVGAAPIDLQNVNTTLPNVTDAQLTEELISSIYDADPTASVQGGSAIRDLFIDPVVSEMSRIRVVLDFCYKATNFVTLNNIDDPTGLGESLDVGNSTYKQLLQEALFIDTPTQMQNLIDLCFDRLASNLGIKRKAGAVARGEATFFTRSAPTFDLVIPIGQIITGGGSQFRVLQSGIITVAEAPNFYNPITRRYEITLPIQAFSVGIDGNLTSGQITAGAPLGLNVTNMASTFGGTTRENNQALTSRAMTYISSVDVGTKSGYERIARESAGVEGYEVIDADNPYMLRDNELGGKVDIWVRGEILSNVTDVYAPSYRAKRGSRFVPLYSEGSYQFLASDATIESPLHQMINRAGAFGLKVQTGPDAGQFFDLTGSSILDNILTLDKSIPQPTYRMTDIILGDYRTDVTNNIILTRQPVRKINSVKKADGTDLPFTFYKKEDPLMRGQSSKAQDYIIFDNTEGEKIIAITGEQHTLNEFYAETLINRGVDITTIVVKDSNDVAFKSPFQNASPDYLIEVNDDLTTIKRTTNTNITSSQTVFVDYEHLENITVSYQTNLVVSNLQLEIDSQKHLGADVLIKEVLPVRVNIKGLIYLEPGVSPSATDSLIRAALENRIREENLGGRLFSSDIIREIDFVQGVSYVSIPLTQLSLTAGDQILREEVSPASPIEITQFQSTSHKLWIMDTDLNHVPDSSGGENARVFLDGNEIGFLTVGQRETLANWNGVKGSIVGLEKAYINVDGVPQEIANSARKVMLSLPLGKTPIDYTIEVNYTCGDGKGVVGELRLSKFTYFEVGELSFTYEERR